MQCTGRKAHQRSKIVQTKIRHREKGKQIHALLCLDTNKIAMNNNFFFLHSCAVTSQAINQEFAALPFSVTDILRNRGVKNNFKFLK